MIMPYKLIRVLVRSLPVHPLSIIKNMSIREDLLVLTYIVQFLFVRAQDGPVVTLSTGRVLGQIRVSAANRLYYSFQSIPYAAPPLGNLRFKAPQPPEKWNGTLKAFDIPPACPQPQKEPQPYPESYNEDCLFLNVFTPHLKPPRGTLMPVMVWIHGGKHYKSSSTIYKYGADFLISEDVVVVSLNYRLGVLGYLNMYTKSAQGNAGDKDKVAALKWVKKEIKHFGGDPNLVTIFGGSSGAQDVHALYLSPMAKGLFHRAIIESCHNCGMLETYSFNPGVKLADIVGCPSTDKEAAVACLRNMSAQYLVEKQMEVVTPNEQIGFFEIAFNPTVEEFHGEEMFLPNFEDDLLKSSMSEIPCMMGITNGEGMMDLRLDNNILFNNFDTNFMSHLPSFMTRNADPEVLAKIEKILKKFYFGRNSISPTSLENIYSFVDLITDMEYAIYTRRIAQVTSSHAPVYLYYFTFKGHFETPNPFADSLNLTTVGHGGELGYLFYRNVVVPNQNHLAEYQRDSVTLSRMVQLWTNFAKYGNPTPNVTDRLLSETWLPVNGSFTQHLIISDALQMERSNLLADRMAVWDRVYSMLEGEEEEKGSQTSIVLVIFVSVTILGLIAFLYLVYISNCNKGYTSI